MGENWRKSSEKFDPHTVQHKHHVLHLGHIADSKQ